MSSRAKVPRRRRVKTRPEESKVKRGRAGEINGAERIYQSEAEERNTQQSGREVKFQYQPLARPWEIRVVELLPRNKADPTAPVRCQLRHIPGADASQIDPYYDSQQDATKVPYQALSYTWGDAKDRREIFVDDAILSVTFNLHEFLMLHSPPLDHLSFHMWIDAICINQDDLQERSGQVKRMRTIYEAASSVILWLGPAAEDSDMAMGALWILAEENIKLEKFRHEETDAPETGVEFNAVVHKDAVISLRVRLTEELLIAIYALRHRAWWQRVWIIQEATVPGQSYHIVCGDRIMPLSTLERGRAQLYRMVHATPELESLTYHELWDNERAGDLFRINDVRKSAPGIDSLLQLVHLGRTFTCSDQRDHIYGFIAMAESDSQLIKPDYSKSVSEVYKNFAWQNIIFAPHGNSLDILGYAGSHGSTHASGELAPRTIRAARHVAHFVSKHLLGSQDLTTEDMCDLLISCLDTMDASAAYEFEDEHAHKGGGIRFNSSYRMACLALIKSQDAIRATLQQLRANTDQAEEVLGKLCDDMSPDLVDALAGQMSTGAMFESLERPRAFPVALMMDEQDAIEGMIRQFYLPLADLTLPPQERVSTTDNPNLSQADQPSWVPQWQFPCDVEPLPKRAKTGSEDGKLLYCAAGMDQTLFANAEKTLFTLSRHELQLRGFLLDNIKTIVRAKLMFALYPIEEEQEWEEQECDAVEGSLEAPDEIYEATNQSKEEAFWRTRQADLRYHPSGAPAARLEEDSRRPAVWGPAQDGRDFVLTERDFMGLVPESSVEGDQIFVLFGGSVLYVLRPSPCSTVCSRRYQYIGECYLHGMMDGQALKMLENKTANLETIRII